jgi:hypothetical protein
MRRRGFLRQVGAALLLAAALPLLAACGSAAPADAPLRIAAFGDVHGDLDAALRALRLAGAVDEAGDWCGGELVVVQTGDQLDRGDDEAEILLLFEKLAAQAEAAGGAFHSLLGNHELMNVAGDLRYVTPGGFADFAARVEVDPSDAELARAPAEQRARIAAFRPGGPYARLLAEHPVVLQVGRTVFVHGGLLPAHLDYGIERINAETRAWLRGEAGKPGIFEQRDSPVWARTYSHEPAPEAAAIAAEVLAALGAERMVVGHTVQEGGITSACDGLVWCIDVGLAAHYGGPVEVLLIEDGVARVLRG